MKCKTDPKVLFIFFVIIFSSCVHDQSDKDHTSTCKVGINLTLTGNAANLGSAVNEGLMAGFDLFNDTCTTCKIEVIVDDNQMDPNKAVSITKKMLNVDNVDVMISGYTPIVKATSGIVNSVCIPFLGTLTSANDITDGMPWVFRDFVKESDYMPFLAKYAWNEGYKKGSCLVINDDFGLDARRYFTDAFTGFGGQMDDGEVFEAVEMDLRNKIISVLSSDPDFIVISGRGSAMINGIRQIRDKLPMIPLFLTVSIDDDKVWKALGSAGEGIVFTRIYIELSDPGFIRANENFNEKMNRNMNWLNVYGYSIANYLCEGFYYHGCSADSMKKYMENLSFQSIRGELRMNENREVTTSLNIYKRENETFIKINQ